VYGLIGRRNIRSFDVFDTLVARRLPTDTLLECMEMGDDFVRNRKAADNGQRDLLEIYQHMEEQGQIPNYTIKATPQRLMEDEIGLETRNLYPIKENMDKVEDGDILVSDMYIPGPYILAMVRACGLTKQVTIYQSGGDKASGAFWKGLKDAGIEPEYHIGDNATSDFNRAVQHGFKAIHYNRHAKITDIEVYLKDRKLPTLGRLIHEITQSSDQAVYAAAQTIATQLNLPWLFVVCEMIQRKVSLNTFNTQPVTFLGRDCQLMYRIFNTYFRNSYYLPFSRKVALENPESASFYLKTQAPRFSLFVDISSTGRTWEKLANAGYARHEVLVVIHSDQYHYSATKPVLPSTFSSLTTNSEVGPSNILLEIFNCGDHGRLDKLEIKNGFPIATFVEPELDKKLVWAIHNPIHKAVELVDHYFDITDELSQLSDENLLQVFKDLKNTICTQHRVMQLLPDYVKKDEEYTQECRSL
jgi:hypothetical protein